MRRLAVLTALVSCLVAAPAGAQTNVVLIVTDDQRWDTLAYMPTVQAELVGKGVTFENAFAANPLCCPSRASILTGTWSHSNGVWTNAGDHGGFPAFDDRETLPVWLQAAGSQTMLVGKYLNGYGPGNAPATYVPPGWDRWLSFYGGTAYSDYLLTDGAAVTPFGSEPEHYSTDVLGAAAADFIRDSSDPFFLFFAPFAPHFSGSAFTAEPALRHVDRYLGLGPPPRPNLNEANVRDKPSWLHWRRPLPLDRLETLREEQLETLLAVDEAVDLLLAALAETGKLADTLIVFTSDNGYYWGEHRLLGKSLPYEEALRVPLVIRWDASGLPVRTARELVGNVDIAQTVVDAAGLSVDTAGRSLLPLMAGPRPWRRHFLIENGAGSRSYCGYRSKDWKYVQYASGKEELYDLESDPYELRNAASSGPRRPLVMEYRGFVRRSDCRPPGFSPLPLCSRSGTRKGDRIRGTGWRDWICAGRGWDTIRVRRGGRDTVNCGPGRDIVYASRLDRVSGNCERVRRWSRR